MRILLTGANGFIGRQLLVALRRAGHEVVAGVRTPAALVRAFPGLACMAVDLNRDTSPDAWLPRLSDVDAVINCAGVMQGTAQQDIEAIHHLAPRALFEACTRAGVRRVIQVSAISAEPAAGTAYALSKWRGDEALRRLDLDWVVLRPSLVYGDGSFGGTSLLRGLAGSLYFVPLVGRGTQPFRPLHVHDLAAEVIALLAKPEVTRVTLEPVGPEELTLRDIVLNWRDWLGFGQAVVVPVPRWLVAGLCRLGDLVGARSFNTSALRQLEYGNAGRGTDAAEVTGVQPRRMAEWLAERPAEVQDRWHARLVMLRPLVRLTLAALWIGSGLAGLLGDSAVVERIALQLGFGNLAAPAVYAFCGFDILLGLTILTGWRPLLVGSIQLLAVAGYTIGLSLAWPELWLGLWGPLLKNLPILALIGVWMAIEPDR